MLFFEGVCCCNTSCMDDTDRARRIAQLESRCSAPHLDRGGSEPQQPNTRRRAVGRCGAGAGSGGWSTTPSGKSTLDVGLGRSGTSDGIVASGVAAAAAVAEPAPALVLRGLGFATAASAVRASARRFACATETSFQKPHSGSALFGLFDLSSRDRLPRCCAEGAPAPRFAARGLSGCATCRGARAGRTGASSRAAAEGCAEPSAGGACRAMVDMAAGLTLVRTGLCRVIRWEAPEQVLRV
eukprot:COSAG04_NODE_2786_length_3581_cov_1.586157_3_plen_241_part_00